jgi:hypothetical protein
MPPSPSPWATVPGPWQDPWIQGRRVFDIALDLLAVVHCRRWETRMVSSAFHSQDWIGDITGSLTVPVLLQYLDLHQCIEELAFTLNTADKFVWRWCSSGAYSVSSAYSAFLFGQMALLGAKELWKTRAMNTCRFFYRLVLHGRCWTSNGLQCHSLRNNGPCALCSQHAETIDHLLVGCVFSREVWFSVFHR